MQKLLQNFLKHMLSCATTASGNRSHSPPLNHNRNPSLEYFHLLSCQPNSEGFHLQCFHPRWNEVTSPGNHGCRTICACRYSFPARFFEHRILHSFLKFQDGSSDSLMELRSIIVPDSFFEGCRLSILSLARCCFQFILHWS